MRRVAFYFLILFYTSGCLPESSDPDFHELDPGPFRAVYLVPDPDATQDHFELILQAGEIDNSGPEGLAHYVEHLAWLPQIDRNRETSRHGNAWTSNFATGYFISGPSEDAGENISRLAGIFEPFQLPEQFLTQERDIVMREYDFRVVENPFFAIYREMTDLLYQSSVYAKAPIGSPASIRSFDLSGARVFHEATHRPENTVLVVKGKTSKSDLQEIVDALPDAPDVPVTQLPYFAIVEGRVEQERSVARLAEPELQYAKLVALQYVMQDALFYATLEVLEECLDSVLPGGIAGPLRFDAFIARRYDFNLQSFGNSFIQLNFTAAPDQGVGLAQLQEAFEAALAANAPVGIPKETFEKVKAQNIENMENLDDQPGTTYALLTSQIKQRKPVFGYSAMRDAYADVTLDKVNTLYDAILSSGRVVSFHLNPEL